MLSRHRQRAEKGMGPLLGAKWKAVWTSTSWRFLCLGAGLTAFGGRLVSQLTTRGHQRTTKR